MKRQLSLCWKVLNIPLWSEAGFRWKEPRSFIRLRDARERASRRWWVQPLVVLIYVSLVLAAWYFASRTPGKNAGPLSSAMVRGLIWGSLMVYLLPWVISFCPSYVKLSDSGITCSRGNQHRQAKYTVIKSFAWRLDNRFTTLVLEEGARRRETVVAIPEEGMTGDISRFLLDKQVQPRSLAGDSA